jgi:two-component sensor histidine kinase
MIAHELINNAARHAFAKGTGRIRLELARNGDFVECRVLDNGSAAASVRPGRGLKIVNELARGLGGKFEQSLGPRGSIFVVSFPYRPAKLGDETHQPKMAGITEQSLGRVPM